MSRVKILKTELWDNDIPALCMICGENPAQTKHETEAKYVPFPLNLLGILGTMATPKKIPFSVVCCNDCKPGYINESNMQTIWQGMHTAILFWLLIAFTVQSSSLPKSLVLPGVAIFSWILLKTVYFWAIGRKSAIRVAKMDEGTVSFDMPSGKWGVAYTKYKREKLESRKKAQGPGPGAVQPPVAAPTGPPPEPGQGPTIGQSAASTSVGGGGIPMDGADVCQLPDVLPPFLDAVKQGNTVKMDEYLKAGEDINQSLPNGMNALHISALEGQMQIADMLIRKGLPVNGEVGNGLTAMHLAVQSNNQNMVGLLLAKKGDPNHKNQDGRTPCHWCAAVQDERLDPNNRYKMAVVLARGGGDGTITDKDGKTPTELAEQGGEGKVGSAFS